MSVTAACFVEQSDSACNLAVPALRLRRLTLAALMAFSALVGGLANLATAETAQPPNVLLILTDDQGWSTLGCYGGRIVDTPNLDRLATEGARFTSAYVTSQCTPTRATLLSGQYTARNRMWHVIGWYGCPWARIEELPFREQFPRGKATLASELKWAGYATGIMGKWHLTNNADGDYQGLRPGHSAHYGFDFAAPVLTKDEFSQGADRGVATLTQAALEFIDEHRNQPWFCFLSHHMIHGTVVAPTTLEDKYRQRGFGEEGPNRAVYLAGLETIDRSIGKLMDGLQAMGEAENTVVIFLSDNGGIDERLEHRSLAKPHSDAPKLQANLREYDNAPLRDGKGSIYEGGVRVPMIVRWPSVVPAGLVIQQPVHAVDIAPTISGMAGHTWTTEAPLDGMDLSELLKTGHDGRLDTRPIFQYCPFYDLNWGLTPCASVRMGDYKLIEFFGDRFDAQHQYIPGRRIELYELSNDLGETHNLAERQPSTAAKLLERLHTWMSETDVQAPEQNLHHDPARAFETTRSKPEWLVE